MGGWREGAAIPAAAAAASRSAWLGGLRRPAMLKSFLGLESPEEPSASAVGVVGPLTTLPYPLAVAAALGPGSLLPEGARAVGFNGLGEPAPRTSFVGAVAIVAIGVGALGPGTPIPGVFGTIIPGTFGTGALGCGATLFEVLGARGFASGAIEARALGITVPAILGPGAFVLEAIGTMTVVFVAFNDGTFAPETIGPGVLGILIPAALEIVALVLEVTGGGAAALVVFSAGIFVTEVTALGALISETAFGAGAVIPPEKGVAISVGVLGIIGWVTLGCFGVGRNFSGTAGLFNPLSTPRALAFSLSMVAIFFGSLISFGIIGFLTN